MDLITTSDDIKKLGTILGVWAHPDDETFTMGGIMAMAVQNGQKVACVMATRGELGVRDEARWPAADLGQIRSHELANAMLILGVNEPCWLDYPDNGCKSINSKKAIKAIAECIERYQPDTIFTFGRDGLTGHPDHCSVSAWTSEAVKTAGSKAMVYASVQTHDQYAALCELDKEFNLFFNIDKPPLRDPSDCGICVRLSDDVFELKLAALRAMPSQYEDMLKVADDSLRVSVGTEAFVEIAF